MNNKNVSLLKFIPSYYADCIRKIDELCYFQKLINSKENLIEEAYALNKTTIMSFEEAADCVVDKYVQVY